LRDGGWLIPNALVIVEERADAELALPEGYKTLETRLYGETKIVILGCVPSPLAGEG
jgi:16S rRNA (guanine966-N2)-methyltransferase